MLNEVESTTILRDLLFVPSKIGMPGEIAGSTQLDTSVVLKTETSGRRVTLGLPVVVRDLGPQMLGKYWGRVCGLLRQHGVPLHCPLAALDAVTAGEIPLRIGQRHRDVPLDSVELKNSDAFELDLRSGQANLRDWSWPAELTSPKRLAACVAAVRAAAGGDTPVGVVLPLGAAIVDIKKCLQANVDFLSLVGLNHQHVDGLAVQGVVQSRSACVEHGRADLPILVDVPIQQVSDIPKFLALGASAVSVDELIKDELRKTKLRNKQIGTGMLAGIANPATEAVDPLSAVADLFVELRSHLEQQMNLCGAQSIVDLSRKHLRAQSQSASQIADVAHLSAAVGS